MGYSNQEGVVFENVSMAASYNSPAIETRYSSFGYLQLSWSSYDGSGDFSLEVSADGQNWDAWPDSSETLNTAADSHSWMMDKVPAAYIRLKYTRTSGSTGTMTLRKLMKGI